MGVAYAKLELIDALETAALRLRRGAPYQWGHLGQCNCGHLAQVVTGRDDASIHRAALQLGGEWADRAREYCATSGLAVDTIVGRLIDLGFSTNDLAELEALSNDRVLRRLPSGRRYLQRNRREDVVEYLETWAAWLREELEAREAASPRSLMAAE